MFVSTVFSLCIYNYVKNDINMNTRGPKVVARGSIWRPYATS